MSFYITTPLYYVNDTPHIGHAYTTVVCDVLTRYHKLFGEKTFFLTGTDEHGQKVENAAAKNGRSAQDHVDKYVEHFKSIWKELQIEEDFFIRTTMDFHKKAVQKCLQDLFDRGEIYEKDYEGLYCESEEIFYTEKELIDGKTPLGNEVQLIKEKNYFFKMSKYQEKLIAHIEANPNFIQPDVRKNEILGFLRKPLGDLSISRPKTRLKWGIEIPFDTDHVTYVWFDALLNYATAIGYQQDGKEEQFNELWPNAIHVIGKDILMTHSVYWTTMLMALNLPLPKQIFAHGWWLTEGDEKMSKSKGSVVKPLDLKDLVGVHGLRYFLTRDINFGNDAQFKTDLVLSRVNTDLANNLGNLISRSTNLVNKYFDGKLPEGTAEHPATLALINASKEVPEKVKTAIYNMAPQDAVDAIIQFLNVANKYLEDIQPWKVAKEDLNLAGECLYGAIETARIATTLLTPVIPAKSKEVLDRIGWSNKPRFEDTKSWGLSKPGTLITKGDPIFPRVQLPKE